MERAGRKFGRVAGDFADGVFAELEELRIEGARLDGEERRPFNGDVIFGGEAARGFLRFANHDGEDIRVERTLIHRDFRGAGNGGDEAGLDFDDAGGADDSRAGLRMAARDFAAFERGGSSGEKSVAAHVDGGSASVSGLANETQHVALKAESAEDDAGGFVLRFKRSEEHASEL